MPALPGEPSERAGASALIIDFHAAKHTRLNTLGRWASKDMMFFITIPSRNWVRLQLALYWARGRVHRRLVLVLALAGALAGLGVSALTPRIYAARVVIDAGPDAAFGPYEVREPSS